MKKGQKCVILDILKTGVITQTILRFYVTRSLWGVGISNDPNDPCRKTPHIITILKTGGQYNGYIS